MAEAIFSKGMAEHQKGKFEEAKKFYREALASDPKHLRANANLASLLKDDPKNIEEATGFFETALGIDGNHPGVLFNFGSLLVDSKKDIPRGRDMLVKSLTAPDPNPVKGVSNAKLGSLFENEKNDDEAIKHYREALKYAPTLAQVHYSFATLLKKKKDDLSQREAIIAYSEAQRIDPTNKAYKDIDKYIAEGTRSRFVHTHGHLFSFMRSCIQATINTQPVLQPRRIHPNSVIRFH